MMVTEFAKGALLSTIGPPAVAKPVVEYDNRSLLQKVLDEFEHRPSRCIEITIDVDDDRLVRSKRCRQRRCERAVVKPFNGAKALSWHPGGRYDFNEFALACGQFALLEHVKLVYSFHGRQTFEGI